MKKKILTLLLAVACVASLSACADKGENQADSSIEQETNADSSIGQETNADSSIGQKTNADSSIGQKTNADSSIRQETNADSKENVPDTEPNQTDAAQEDTEGVEYEYPSEDAGTVVQESSLGYSMTYDPTVFTLDDTGEADVFTYNTAEILDAPAYLSVQSYPDMDAEALAEGLVLQSGIDGVEAQDAYFGADGMETKLVYIEKEVEGVKQIQIFYAIPAGEGSLLVERGSYVGVPENVEWKFEEMLGTFSLTAE